MRFSKAEPDATYFLRFVSESGRWEVGLHRVLYGVRVQLSLVGDVGPTLDYCAGADTTFIMELLCTLIMILDGIPENMPQHELEALFPGYTIRPIDKDPVCWPYLQQMAFRPQPEKEDKMR